MFVEELFSISGKHAVVTGATQGIGLMIAEGLLRAGAEVLICGRRQHALDNVVERLSRYGPCSGCAADLATHKGIDYLVEHISATRQTLHILVNNAGITWGAPLDRHTRDDFAKVVNLNLTTIYELSRRLFPLLRSSAACGEPARVIMIASMQAFAGPRADN
jgi:NAD(P)-dependent dehydrogenase (short-subunit alcohol dehydrogenase family)